MIRGRLLRRRGSDAPAEDEFIEIDPSELSGLFAAPRWLRDLGFTSWLLVGVVLLLVGLISILSPTQFIVIPVMWAGVTGGATGPLLSLLKRQRFPRGLVPLSSWWRSSRPADLPRS